MKQKWKLDEEKTKDDRHFFPPQDGRVYKLSAVYSKRCAKYRLRRKNEQRFLKKKGKKKYEEKSCTEKFQIRDHYDQRMKKILIRGMQNQLGINRFLYRFPGRVSHSRHVTCSKSWYCVPRPICICYAISQSISKYCNRVLNAQNKSYSWFFFFFLWLIVTLSRQ